MKGNEKATATSNMGDYTKTMRKQNEPIYIQDRTKKRSKINKDDVAISLLLLRLTCQKHNIFT